MMSTWSHVLCVLIGCAITMCIQASLNVPPVLEVEQSGHMTYCNIPNAIHGTEGKSIRGYIIKHVDLIMSPGEIHIPLDQGQFQGQTVERITSCDLKFDSTFSDKVNSFSEVSDIFRVVQREHHGFKDLHPTFSSPCTDHHVTSFGLRQMVLLGEHLNAAYFHSGLDSKLVLKASRLHIESLPSYSTYQSLLSFLHGLLPEKQFTKVKVKKSLENFCSLSNIGRETCTCRYTQDLKAFVTGALEKGHYMFKESLYGADQIKSVMGECLTGDAGGIKLLEHLMLYRCSHMSSPRDNGTSFHCPSQQQLHQLYLLSSQYLQHLNTDPTFMAFSRMTAYPLLSRLVHRSFCNKEDRMSIYMGSRSFLQYLRASLGLQQREVMPLGSRFAYEVYQKIWGQADGGDLYLRFIFNGEDVTGQVNGCKDLENGLCPMKSFNTTVLSLGKEYSNMC